MNICLLKCKLFLLAYFCRISFSEPLPHHDIDNENEPAKKLKKIYGTSSEENFLVMNKISSVNGSSSRSH